MTRTALERNKIERHYIGSLIKIKPCFLQWHQWMLLSRLSRPDVRVVCASVYNCVCRQLKVCVHWGHWRHSVHTHSFLQAAAHAVKVVVTQIIIISKIRLRAHNHAQIWTIVSLKSFVPSHSRSDWNCWLTASQSKDTYKRSKNMFSLEAILTICIV